MIDAQNNTFLYFKLISLWVVIEAFLGGIIHSVGLPITGLLIASGAVICLSLIACFCNTKNAIIKATIIVVVFKAMLSPQAPATAYIAVFFQGIVANILFININYFKVKCMTLAILALVESAIQKIIVLMVLYSATFFSALDVFTSKLLHQKSTNQYSLYIAFGYVMIHLIIAVFVGLFAAQLPHKIIVWKRQYPLFNINETIANKAFQSSTNNKKNNLIIKAIVAFLCLGVAFYFLKSTILNSVILKIIFRTLAIFICWHFILNPLLKYTINKWVSKQEEKNKSSINKVLYILPITIEMVIQCWQKSIHQNKENKLKLFAKLVVVNIVNEEDE